jgi:hypothetical protein
MLLQQRSDLCFKTDFVIRRGPTRNAAEQTQHNNRSNAAAGFQQFRRHRSVVPVSINTAGSC